MLSGGGYQSGSVALVNGGHTFTIPAGSLSIGVDNLRAAYSGDGTYLARTGSAVVTASKASVTLTVLPSASSVTTVSSLSVTAKIAGSGVAPTGTVIISGGGYNSKAMALSKGSYTFTIPAGGLNAGSDSLTVNYSGDGTYLAASGASIVMVTKAAPTLTLTPGAGSVVVGSSLKVAVKLTSVATTPTGTVTLSGGSFRSAPGTLINGSYVFTIPANSLIVGSDTLTASYSGDSTYLPIAGTGKVTVTKGAQLRIAGPGLPMK
jgi:hypothetical protein